MTDPEPMLHTTAITHDGRPIALVGDLAAGVLVVAAYATAREEVLGVLVPEKSGEEWLFRRPGDEDAVDAETAVRRVLAG